MSISILGLGTAVPPYAMSQSEALELAQATSNVDARTQRLLNVLYRRCGVANRHTCLPHHTALTWRTDHHGSLELAKQLAQAAESAGGLAPEHLDNALGGGEAPGRSAGDDTQNNGQPSAKSREGRVNGSGSELSRSEAGSGPTTAERMQFYESFAYPLARRAAQTAFDAASVSKKDVTHLVTVSCTGFYSPGVDVHLMRHFDLPPTAQRVHVGFMGCHGAVNGLRVAQGLAASCPGARILLCAVELCSVHYRVTWDPERSLGNALFADGAGVLVLGDEPARANASAWRLIDTGSCLIPDSLDAMTWRIGDHGFEMTLSAAVPDLIQRHLRPWLTSWLADRNLTLDDVASWAVHPGGPRILSSVQECLGLSDDALWASRETLAQQGNMSSPTVLFILERLQTKPRTGPCVVLGFGPGLVAEVALLETSGSS